MKIWSLHEDIVTEFRNVEYSCRESDWTDDPDQAQNFFEVVRALDYAMNNGFEDVRVVMKFEDVLEDVELPPVHLAAGRGTH